MPIRPCRAILALVLAAAYPSASLAVEIIWDGNGATPPRGNWSLPANWLGDVRPTNLTDATFSLPDTYQVTVDAPSTAKDLLFKAGDVTLSLGSQSLQASGVLRLSGGTLTTSNFLRQGTASSAQIGATGGFQITGGTLNVNSMNASGTGMFDFTGGTIAVRTGLFTPKLATVTFQVSQGSTSDTMIGSAFAVSGLPNGSTPAFLLTAGADYATTGSSFVVGYAGGKGTALVDGPGTWLQTNQTPTADGYLYLGLHARSINGVHVASEGDLTVRNRGEVTSRYATIGREGGTGNLHVTGVGTKLTIQSSLRVGESYFAYNNRAFRPGTGTVRIENGATAVASFMVVGILGGEGRVDLSGQGSSLSGTTFTVGTGRYLQSIDASGNYLGDGPGHGVWNLTDGASANFTMGGSIGYNGGHGEVVISSATLNSGGRISVGLASGGTSGDASGSLSVLEGGLLNTSSALAQYMAIGSSDGVGRLTVRSGAATPSRWTHTGNVAIGSDGYTSYGTRGTGTLDVGTGGEVTITGSLLTAPAASSEPGKRGGTLLLSGGHLQVPSITNQGKLLGSGHITSAVTNSGTLSPGNGVGTLQIDGDLTQTGTGGLFFDLGGTAVGQTDRIDVTGMVTLSGKMTVGAVSGYTPLPGASYELLTFASASGSLELIDGVGLAGLHLSQRITGGSLFVDAAATPGDINLDGRVGFDDLLVLAQYYDAGLGQSWLTGDFNADTAVNFDDLLLISQHYGSPNGLDAEAFAADWALAQSLAPEPAVLSGVILGVYLLGRRR